MMQQIRKTGLKSLQVLLIQRFLSRAAVVLGTRLGEMLAQCMDETQTAF